jgi:hypothetical protein
MFINLLAESDSVGLGNCYTADAKIWNANIPSTTGRADIIHFYGDMIRNGMTGFQVYYYWCLG